MSPAPASAAPSALESWRGDRIPALDGLRGLAILLVMMCHYVDMDPPPGWAGRAFFTIAWAGWCGVDLFFVLSGFLITGILLDAKGSAHCLRNFYMRRFLRIFPLYYGLLLALFVVWPAVHEVRSADARFAAAHQGWAWLYAMNILQSLRGQWIFDQAVVPINHFWSLAVEEHFYVVWPALVLLLSQKALIRTCAALVVGALALRVILTLTITSDLPAYVLTPCRIDGLALGGLIAAMFRAGGAARLQRLAGPVLVISLLGMGALVAARRSVFPWDPWFRTAGFTLLALLFGATVVRAVTAAPGSLAHTAWTLRPLRFLGKYSYALYVFHLPLVAVLARWGPLTALEQRLGDTLASTLVFMACGFTVSIAVAFASWHLYEKQFLALKRFFDYRPRKAEIEVNGARSLAACAQKTAG